MDTIEIISLVLNLVLGSGLAGTLVTLKSKRRQESATATREEASAESVAIANLREGVVEWRQIAEAREEKLAQRDALIDRLYLEKSEDRRVQHSQLSKINQLEIENANLKIRVCNVRGCEERDPPSEIF